MGEGHSNMEIIKTVEEVMGTKVNVKVMPKREGDANVLFADISKIKNELGWQPECSIHEIVKTAYLWHKGSPSGYNNG